MLSLQDKANWGIFPHFLVGLNMNFVEGYVVWIPGAFQIQHLLVKALLANDPAAPEENRTCLWWFISIHEGDIRKL